MAAERKSTTRIRLRPQDPFDLIRLLARSQSDPRKAVAELVQNSLDAGARRIEITWFNERGQRALRIWDDGEGVFPELERTEALRRIAKTIGHSHKRDLTPAERREQMIAGKYGIGLIGFWSVGESLEMKSRVGGGRAHVLRLREDRAHGEVAPSASRRIDETDTFTAVTIHGIHEAALGKIRPPRLQAYLANELRGQLLERDAVVRIRDRVARGRARKEFVVRPRPYLGLPLEDWRELEVPGFESARVELYLVRPEEDRHGTVALSCGGTVVLDDVALIDGDDAPRAPWSSGALEGVIDFPELYVAPGSRRGFAHDEPVATFLEALGGLEREVSARLEDESRRRAEQRRESVAREIRRAFRSVARRLPEYDFFGVRASAAADGGGADRPSSEAPAPASRNGSTDGAPLAPDAPAEPAREPAPSDEGPDGHLFPPGPLATVEVRPKSLRLAPLSTRSLRARALDADGRPCRAPVGHHWKLEGEGELESDGPRASFTAPDVEPDRAGRIEIHVLAVAEGRRAEAIVPVRIAEAGADSARVAGIPEPFAVTAPGESWRSRVRGDRWEYNDAHRDYLAVAEVEARRLRYLIHLFAKEVVLRNFGRPGDDEVLERMVEVLASLDAEGRR